MSIGDLNSNVPLNVQSITFGDGSALSMFIEAGYSSSLTGAITSPALPGLVRLIGKVAFFSVTGYNTNSIPAGGPIFFSTKLPIPPYPVKCPVWVINNNVEVPGTANVDFDGTLSLTVGNGIFTGNTQCGFQAFSISYPIYAQSYP